MKENHDNNIIFLKQQASEYLSLIREAETLMERERILQQHKSKIWKNNRGKWQTRIPDSSAPTGKRVITRSSEEALKNALFEHYKKNEYSGCTFRELFEEANKDQKDVTYRKYLSVFNAFYGEAGMDNKKVMEITQRDLEKFIYDQFEKKLTAKRFADLKTITKAMLKLARYKGLTDISPTEFFEDLYIQKHQYKQASSKREDFYTDDECVAIYKYVSEHQTTKNLAIMVQMEIGCRVGEIVALNVSDVDFKAKTLHIHRTEQMCRDKDSGAIYKAISDSAKTDQGNRTVIVTDEVLNIIRLCITRDESDYVFSENGKNFTTKQIQRCLSNMCKQVGIKSKGTHGFRRTYASKLRKAGASNEFIVSQLGHTDISTTQKYYINDITSREEAEMILSKTSIFNALADVSTDVSMDMSTQKIKIAESLVL